MLPHLSKILATRWPRIGIFSSSVKVFRETLQYVGPVRHYFAEQHMQLSWCQSMYLYILQNTSSWSRNHGTITCLQDKHQPPKLQMSQHPGKYLETYMPQQYLIPSWSQKKSWCIDICQPPTTNEVKICQIHPSLDPFGFFIKDSVWH